MAGDGEPLACFLVTCSLREDQRSRGDFDEARTSIEKSLTRAREFNDNWLLRLRIGRNGGVVASQGDVTWAVHLWSMADSLREHCGIPQTPVERADYEPAVAAARIQLGEQAFANAWAEGRSMTLEQVLGAPGQAAVPTPPSAEQAATTTTKPPPRSPDSLSAREVEVLRLVAQGLTDAQVAEHLVISPRTVNFHLTSIYGKIGLSSRMRLRPATRWNTT